MEVLTTALQVLAIVLIDTLGRPMIEEKLHRTAPAITKARPPASAPPHKPPAQPEERPPDSRQAQSTARPAAGGPGLGGAVKRESTNLA